MKNVAFTICLCLMTTSWNVLLKAQISIQAQKVNANTATLAIQAKVLVPANCIDSEDGIIEVVAKGGQEPYQYIEIKGKEITTRLETGNTFSKLDPDKYTLRVVDAAGYEATTELILDAVKPAPIADFEMEKTATGIKFINSSAYTGRWSWQINEAVTYEEAPTLSATDDFKEVCIVASNGCNAKDIYCETINVKNELVGTYAVTSSANNLTSKKERLNEFEVLVFPNPTTDRLTVKYNDTEALESIEVYAITGRLLKKVAPQSEFQTTLSMGDYPAGMYLVKVNGATSAKTLRVSKVD